jgi:hypothetical protein
MARSAQIVVVVLILLIGSGLVTSALRQMRLAEESNQCINNITAE